MNIVISVPTGVLRVSAPARVVQPREVAAVEYFTSIDNAVTPLVRATLRAVVNRLRDVCAGLSDKLQGPRRTRAPVSHVGAHHG